MAVGTQIPGAEKPGTQTRGNAAAGGREPLALAMRRVVRHPWRELLCLWSWKSMLLGATLRALLFLVGNRHGGMHVMLRASLSEALYALPSAGLSGALTQRLALCTPQLAVAWIVWISLPLLLLAGQVVVHWLAGTPHMITGLIGSLIFAMLGSGFTWFAMRRGVLLAGEHARTVRHDTLALPRLIVQFVSAPVRAMHAWSTARSRR